MVGAAGLSFSFLFIPANQPSASQGCSETQPSHPPAPHFTTAHVPARTKRAIVAAAPIILPLFLNLVQTAIQKPPTGNYKAAPGCSLPSTAAKTTRQGIKNLQLLSLRTSPLPLL